jgi:hypothetical protein
MNIASILSNPGKDKLWWTVHEVCTKPAEWGVETLKAVGKVRGITGVDGMTQPQLCVALQQDLQDSGNLGTFAYEWGLGLGLAKRMRAVSQYIESFGALVSGERFLKEIELALWVLILETPIMIGLADALDASKATPQLSANPETYTFIMEVATRGMTEAQTKTALTGALAALGSLRDKLVKLVNGSWTLIRKPLSPEQQIRGRFLIQVTNAIEVAIRHCMKPPKCTKPPK